MEEKERQGSIYVLHNLINDKEYVGQTVKDPAELRWREHIHCMLKGGQRPLYRAMRKYGLKNFTAEVIWVGPESKLNSAERRFIRLRKTFIDTGWGYNLTTGGGQCRFSKQTIRKIRRAAVRQFQDPEQRKRVSAESTARMVDPVARMRLSILAVEQFADCSARLKMSRLKKRQYKSRPEIKERLSKAATLQWASAAARTEKSVVSKAGWARRKGDERKHSKRARRNMALAQTKRFEDPAACAKISAGQRRRYEDPTAHEKSSAGQYKRFAEHPMSAETNAKIAARTRWNWAHNPIFRAKMLECARERRLPIEAHRSNSPR